MKILCDIDGTLTYKADNKFDINDINPKPKDYVIEFINKMSIIHQIFIFTKRRESNREITEKLLNNLGVKYNLLLMRTDDIYGIKTCDIKDAMYIKYFSELDGVALYIEDDESVISFMKNRRVNCIHPNTLRCFSSNGIKEDYEEKLQQHILDTASAKVAS